MKVSLCVCTYNRLGLLERLLGSLRGTKLCESGREDIELIVIDNCPNGEVRALCERMASSLPVSLHVVEEAERGISFARNRAVSEALARGADFIAFIDDDDLPEPDWLVRLIERQKESQADIVLGNWRSIVDETTPDWVKEARIVYEDENYLKQAYGVQLPSRMATCNVLIGRGTLEKLAAEGPVFSLVFLHAGAEDVDFFIRAAQAGATYALADRSIVNKECDESRLTYMQSLQRSYRRGKSSMYVKQKYSEAAAFKRKKKKAFRRVALGLLLLPTVAFSKSRFMAHAYGLSRCLGELVS